VVLLTGIPAIEKCFAFERSNETSEVDEMLKEAMDECVSQERQRQRAVYKDIRIYSNYVSILLELYRMHNTMESIGLFKKLYTLLV